VKLNITLFYLLISLQIYWVLKSFPHYPFSHKVGGLYFLDLTPIRTQLLLDLIEIDQLYLAIKSKKILSLRSMLGETHDVLVAISGMF
jgi:hypothetical protein